jgi:adenylate cyclase, class 2
MDRDSVSVPFQNIAGIPQWVAVTVPIWNRPMKYEVEMKFPVADMAAFESRLGDLGTAISPAQAELDVYFAHPSRDFASTDEALRIRRKGRSNYITYKGPKIDATTKTRREIDLPLPADEESAQAWSSLLEALGFSAVAEVCKSRRKFHIIWQGQQIEGSLDRVEQLGDFAELELVVQPEGVDKARTCIASLAETLGLVRSERRSYLELLRDSADHIDGQ